jgi:hypothetical protein
VILNVCGELDVLLQLHPLWQVAGGRAAGNPVDMNATQFSPGGRLIVFILKVYLPAAAGFDDDVSHEFLFGWVWCGDDTTLVEAAADV